MKLTTPEDFALAERIAAGTLGDVRTGSGFDAHRFGPGDHVWLCGVKIAHDRGLEGHSDADVGLHALTDAILGALGAGDIGMHFPSGDPKWKGQASDAFLARAGQLVRERGGIVAHRRRDADLRSTEDRRRIARPCAHASPKSSAWSIGRVSVKATTTDGLGFTGRGEGIAAQAMATIRLPP